MKHDVVAWGPTRLGLCKGTRYLFCHNISRCFQDSIKKANLFSLGFVHLNFQGITHSIIQHYETLMIFYIHLLSFPWGCWSGLTPLKPYFLIIHFISISICNICYRSMVLMKNPLFLLFHFGWISTNVRIHEIAISEIIC